MADPENMEEVEVVEYDGTVHTVLAAVLGTSEKRTDIERLRVVEESGNIYAKQDGVYYFTQNIDA